MEPEVRLGKDRLGKSSIGESTGASPAPARTQKPARQEYGQYGWVKLTDEEYSRLSNELGGTELKRCIAYIDESAQTSGNKNRWRDWNLVIRRCHRDGWGTKQDRKSTVKTTADYSGGESFV